MRFESQPRKTARKSPTLAWMRLSVARSLQYRVTVHVLTLLVALAAASNVFPLGVKASLANAVAECDRLASHLIEVERLEYSEQGAVVDARTRTVCGEAVRTVDADSRTYLLYGLVLLAEQDFDDGIEWLKRSAEGGNASAEFFAGLTHRLGKTSDSSPELARQWFRKAAVKGHVSAQVFLGRDALSGDRRRERPGTGCILVSKGRRPGKSWGKVHASDNVLDWRWC